MPEYKPYNYGFFGYGTQHLLTKLQSDTMVSEIEEDEGLLIYTFIDDHIHRIIPSMHVIGYGGIHWPYYQLNDQGQLIYKGDFKAVRPFILNNIEPAFRKKLTDLRAKI